MRRVATLLSFALALACQPKGRSVRAWIESRDRNGAIVAGATVEVDGVPLGLTDARGLYRLKIRRRVGDVVRLTLYDERAGLPPSGAWSGAFTVGTNGAPVEFAGGRIVARVQRAEAP